MNGIETMSRDELENYAKEAIIALKELEGENRQLKFDLEISSNIDVRIIDGWRELVNTAERERDKWEALATEMSQQNQSIIKNNEKMRLISSKILMTLDLISKTAHDNANPEIKALKLSRTIKRIEDEANSAKSEILEFFIDDQE